MKDEAPPAKKDPRGGGGCLAAGALFGVLFVSIWLAAVTFYGVIEQWGLVRDRAQFRNDWVFLYAPLVALGVGTAAAFSTMRRPWAARVVLWILTATLIALFGGIVLFGLGGLL